MGELVRAWKKEVNGEQTKSKNGFGWTGQSLKSQKDARKKLRTSLWLSFQ